MTRDKIINAAINIFSKQGYFKASMDIVAKEANVAKGTLYYHFKDKQSLFNAVVTEGIDYLISETKKVLVTGMSASEQIRSIIERNVELYLEYPTLAKLIFNELSSGLEDKVLEEVKKQRRQYVLFLISLLEEGVKYGDIKKMDFYLLANGSIGYLDSVCSLVISKECNYSKEEISDHIFKQLFGSLCTGG